MREQLQDAVIFHRVPARWALVDERANPRINSRAHAFGKRGDTIDGHDALEEKYGRGFASEVHFMGEASVYQPSFFILQDT